jgi:hypothetical protein
VIRGIGRWLVTPAEEITNPVARKLTEVFVAVGEPVETFTWRVVFAYIKHLQARYNALDEKYGREVLTVRAEKDRAVEQLARAERFIYASGMGHIYGVPTQDRSTP